MMSDTYTHKGPTRWCSECGADIDLLPGLACRIRFPTTVGYACSTCVVEPLSAMNPFGQDASTFVMRTTWEPIDWLVIPADPSRLYDVWHARLIQDEHGRAVKILGAFACEPAIWPDDFVHVATVQCNDLGEVFEMTNHINEAWNTRPTQGERLIHMRTTQPVRSTSTGDVVVRQSCPRVIWEVAPVGYISTLVRDHDGRAILLPAWSKA